MASKKGPPDKGKGKAPEPKKAGISHKDIATAKSALTSVTQKVGSRAPQGEADPAISQTANTQGGLVAQRLAALGKQATLSGKKAAEVTERTNTNTQKPGGKQGNVVHGAQPQPSVVVPGIPQSKQGSTPAVSELAKKAPASRKPPPAPPIDIVKVAAPEKNISKIVDPAKNATPPARPPKPNLSMPSASQAQVSKAPVVPPRPPRPHKVPSVQGQGVAGVQNAEQSKVAVAAEQPKKIGWMQGELDQNSPVEIRRIYKLHGDMIKELRIRKIAALMEEPPIDFGQIEALLKKISTEPELTQVRKLFDDLLRISVQVNEKFFLKSQWNPLKDFVGKIKELQTELSKVAVAAVQSKQAEPIKAAPVKQAEVIAPKAKEASAELDEAMPLPAPPLPPPNIPAVINEHINKQVNYLLNVLGAVNEPLRRQAEQIIQNNGEAQTHTQLLTKLITLVKNNETAIKEKIGNKVDYADSLDRLRDSVNAFSLKMNEKPWTPEQIKIAQEAISKLVGVVFNENVETYIGGTHSLLLYRISQDVPDIARTLIDLRSALINENNLSKLQDAAQNLREALQKVISDPKQKDVELKNDCRDVLENLDNALRSVHQQMQFKKEEPSMPVAPKGSEPIKGRKPIERAAKLDTSRPVFLIDISHYTGDHKQALEASMQRINLGLKTTEKYNIRIVNIAGNDKIEISSKDAADIQSSVDGAKAVRNILGNVPVSLFAPIDCKETYLAARNSDINVNFVGIGPSGHNETETYKAMEPKRNISPKQFESFKAKQPKVVPPAAPDIAAPKEDAKPKPPRT